MSFVVKIFQLYIFCFFLSLAAFGQSWVRIKADYTIKEKMDKQAMLSKGTAYYDRSHKKLAYQTSFPEKELWIFRDTTAFKYVNDSLVSRILSPVLPQLTIFHLILQGNLSNYGLKDSPYKVEKVEREANMVVTTWKPDAKLGSVVGIVKIANKDKKLDSVVFYNSKGEIISKQKFKNYINVKGLDVPTEILEIVYSKEGEKYKQTLYKNIVINEMGNDKMYNYPVPK